MIYLTLNQVELLHRRALVDYGGLDGVRAHQLAAAYGFFIAEAQAFVDGNKRTAAAAMLTFLNVNGYDLDQTDDEIAEMFEKLREDVVDQTAFFAWVGRHVKQVAPE